MSIVVVLAMHGAPPLDFPKEELAEFFGLHARLEHSRGSDYGPLHDRFLHLERKMRLWPRTAENDPFWAGSRDLAAALRKTCSRTVIVGFNEFCAPNIDEALDLAAALAAEKIIVVTPMMIRGGQHAERDIPEAVDRARARHPGEAFDYVWPFLVSDIAAFLAVQINKAP
jgi:sirohydrochlorin cobaltochelatase